MTENIDIQGGCACGEITYQAHTKPLAMFNCHCLDCQKASGGTFVSVALFKEHEINVSGKPKFHRSVGDSGRWTERWFCPECGTPLFAKGEVAPGLMTIKPGSLNDASWFKPSMDTWAKHAPNWLVLDPDIPKHKTTPSVSKAK